MRRLGAYGGGPVPGSGGRKRFESPADGRFEIEGDRDPIRSKGTWDDATSQLSGQWWTHPAGCQYSRAGRPGEIVWFLTSVPKGARCPEFIQQKVTDHIYRAPYLIDG